MTGPTMPTIQIRGVPLHYQQLGRPGPDVREIVAVHGLAADLAFWYLGAAPVLVADRESPVRVTMYDLRGHGLSRITERGYTTTDLAADLLELVDRLRIRRPIIVGHSYGAAVGLHAGVIAPDRIAAVIIADGYLPCFEHRPGRLDDRRAQRTVRRLRRLGIDVPTDLPRVAYGWVDELAGPGGLHDRRRGSAPRVPAGGLSALQRWRRLRERSTVAAEVDNKALTTRLLRTCTVPWLAVYGERTPCRASLAGLRRVRPDLEVIEIRHAGHLHPSQQPVVFAEQVQTFVHRLPVRADGGSLEAVGCDG